MPVIDEKMRILKMLEESKITAEQANELLSALASIDNAANVSGGDFGQSADTKQAKWLVVRVTDTLTGKKKTNLRLPVDVIRAAKRFGSAKGKLNIDDLELEDMSELLDAGMTGLVVDLMEEKSNEHVEVFLE
ncbi:MAG TPA: hypothetical protein PKK82_06015 [Anaerolineaceae bacterium]|nr:hypothetical protein [Anaerolineaceae bacterium]